MRFIETGARDIVFFSIKEINLQKPFSVFIKNVKYLTLFTHESQLNNYLIYLVFCIKADEYWSENNGWEVIRKEEENSSVPFANISNVLHQALSSFVGRER